FFQAEDGIRDLIVTGVQTCALPICLELASKVFAHTAAYDAAIHRYLTRDAAGWPERITLALERRQELRYGENPHQAAALYATDRSEERRVGKECRSGWTRDH